MYDTRLVIAAQEGDDAAFAALYDRNAEALYDFCWALTGDDAEATRMVEDAFVLAARHIDEITDASQVRPWLLAIARDRALAEDEAGTLHTAWGMRPAIGDADAVLGNGDLRRWTREAAATLALADQAVLELTTRHELEGDQLAAAIGCEPSQVETVVEQVDHEADEVLGSLVVARQGRRDCTELAALLAGWDGAPSVDVAERVGAHAATCERCAGRRQVAEPLRLVAGAPPVALPGSLRSSVLDRVAPEVAAAAARRAAGTPAPAIAALEADEAGGAGPEPSGAAGAAFAEGAGAAGGAALAAAGGLDPATAARAARAYEEAATMALPGMVGPPAGPGRNRANDGPPWLIIAAAGLAVAVLIAIVVLAVRPSAKSSLVATTQTTVAPSLAPSTSLAPPTSNASQTLVPVGSSTTTSSTTPSAGQLQLDTTNVDLGSTAASSQVLLSDAGPGAVAWKASIGPSWLTARPASGTLKANGSVSVTLAIDRTKAPQGTFSVQVAFIATGTGNVGAVLSVNGSESPPTTTTTVPTSSTTPVGPQLSSLGGTQLAGCQVQVTVQITDAVPVTAATVSYTLPVGTHGSTGMSRTGTTWNAIITGPLSAGTLTFSVTATDSGQSSQTSPTGSVAVTACS